MDRGAWWATVHRIAKNCTWLCMYAHAQTHTHTHTHTHTQILKTHVKYSGEDYSSL